MAEAQPPAPAPQSATTPAALRNRYIIGESAEYATRSFGQPAGPQAVAPPPPAEAGQAPHVVSFLSQQTAAIRAHRAHRAEPDRPTEKRAVWVVHGMGQQVPFETLDSLAQGIFSIGGREHELIPGHPPLASNVKFDAATPGGADQVVQRVELDVRNVHNHTRTCQLHLYEAYWAPETEGAAKVSDVTSFFFNAGFRGILNACQKFHRAMFPPAHPTPHDTGWYLFNIPKRVAVEILLTMLVLLSLIAINAVILAAAVARTKVPHLSLLNIEPPWEQLAALATAICAIALTFGVILFLAEMWKPRGLSKSKKLAICAFGWIGLAITVLSLIAAGLLMIAVLRCRWIQDLLHGMHARSIQGISTVALLCAIALVVIALSLRGSLRSQGDDSRGNGLLGFLFLLAFLLHLAIVPVLFYVQCHPIPQPANFPPWIPPLFRHLALLISSPLWVWPALIFLAKQVREILIEYPGDVVVYIFSNKLDRFDKIRSAIKQIALNSLTSLYTAVDLAGNPLYSTVAVVGHSLGSVIAYDTLNRLLLLDNLTGNHINVSGRTCLFETFGSPLDKIAFFFTIQGKESFHIREELAAVVQPLIQSYPLYRTFDWVNVYSHNDIVSGILKFYDTPENTVPLYPHRVDNVPDPDAVVPLVAHVDYWKNPTVWQQLMARVGP